jgi:hypothetical protein
VADDGCVNFDITISGAPDLELDTEQFLRETVRESRKHYKVKKESDPCPRCRANDDPIPILMAGYYPGCYQGPACRCTVVEVTGYDTRRF